MSNDIRSVLSQFRAVSRSEREKGTYFERLAVAFIKNDPGLAQEYEDAWSFTDWAKARGKNAKDTGIDAVAKLRGEDGFCAIQCKFYKEGHAIQKGEIDSFFTASGKEGFTRRLIIDTTDVPWSANAEDALKGQQIPTTRIGLDRLEQSLIDWSAFLLRDAVVVGKPKQPLPHQIEALESVRTGFADHDRGKLVMACGTGKTFTSLKIAEGLVGLGGLVLFLVPSLSLMSQSVREWTIDAAVPLRSFAVCSDSQVGKRRRSNEDAAEIEAQDLDFPATTDAAKLATKASIPFGDRMTVVFATYQSIAVVAEAQAKHGLPSFDLIICDEAHRTTGARFPGEDDSAFVAVHDAQYLLGSRRLYMTATPRVFGDTVKTKATEAAVELCSMDDEALFGPTFFARGFGWAVEKGLLSDYKVIVLAVDEAMVSSSIQRRLSDGANELKLDDATKIIGCYKALTKAGLSEDVGSDAQPMRRALAFCRDIASSKLVCKEFEAVVSDYLASEEGKADDEVRAALDCQLRHVDGTFGAKARSERLDWLKVGGGEDTCRILTNARCLSEGVDVPALDAVLFLHPRKSQIDVVQSVGRVMRRAAGKRMGYVILPIGVPAGMPPEQALNDNERYRVVWQILNALRSHDERLDETINKMGLGADVSDHIEVIAVTSELPVRSEGPKGGVGIGRGSAAGEEDEPRGHGSTEAVQAEFVFDEVAKAIMARIVKRCGRRDYWENWAGDVAKIAQAHIARISAVVGAPGKEREAFERFLAEIRDDLNETITEAEAIEMLAQHVVTRPVFEALFEGYSFAGNNPVSVAMQSVLDVLDEHALDKEAGALQRFYASVRSRAAGIDDAEGKQRIIVELYDKFFRNAFPRMTEKLGIVYTPVEIVDFILRSVADVLASEFGQTLGSQGIHIIDPFSGTGTFITRLLQSGLIGKDELAYKYQHELHANEIVLLAYYIAAINIEAVYHSLSGGDYLPFEGMCLTDSFQLYEKEDLISALLEANGSRRQRQKKLDIRVILGNPPYSVGQGSANDNNANVEYPRLDGAIRDTYAAHSTATNKNALYDSYIRAIRWGSDRLGESGIMAYVTNAGWVDGDAADGMRKCIAEEFSSIYVFHLRGDARPIGEQRRKEKGNVFGAGSRAPIAVTLFVKNPQATEKGRIWTHDIGDYLTREDKLRIVSDFGSVAGIEAAGGWKLVTPNEHHDWIKQRSSDYQSFIPVGEKGDKDALSIFDRYSPGVKSGRDAWCYNSSEIGLRTNMASMIAAYDSEVSRYEADNRPEVEKFLRPDPKRISWNRGLINDLSRCRRHEYDPGAVRLGAYRPFTRQWMYFSRAMNDMIYRIPTMYPTPASDNISICIIGVPERKGFSVLATNETPNLHLLDTGQCFPLRVYESGSDAGTAGLFTAINPDTASHRHGVSDAALEHFRAFYEAVNISKDDLFFYVYGLLHSEAYRERYQDDLSKGLPRIPCVSRHEDFEAFCAAGRTLVDLHVNYDDAEPYAVTFSGGALFMGEYTASDFRVEKMRFGKRDKVQDRSTVIYNSKITMTNIPIEAYDYVVNGRPALECVMDAQGVWTDKASGIVNDSNRYATETVEDPAYPLRLFQRIITVSLRTMEIVRALPALDTTAPSQDPIAHA